MSKRENVVVSHTLVASRYPEKDQKNFLTPERSCWSPFELKVVFGIIMEIEQLRVIGVTLCNCFRVHPLMDCHRIGEVCADSVCQHICGSTVYDEFMIIPH